MHFCVLLDRDQFPVRVKLRVGRHKVVVWVMIIWAITFVVPGQTICHTGRVTIHVLDDEIKVGKVFPPPSLSAVQARLSLEVLEALMVSYYDELSP